MRRSKIEKILAFQLMRWSAYYKPSLSTRLTINYFRRWGMNFEGAPNYLSSKVWFDGTDYSLITLGEGCTISSYVLILTHDWSADAVLRVWGSPFKVYLLHLVDSFKRIPRMSYPSVEVSPL